MKGRGWAAAAVLVVAVNAFVLVRVAANRRGEPEASLTLTERELPIAFVSPSSESSGVSLRIDVEHWVPWSPTRHTPDVDPFRWLDAGKLAALGFDVGAPDRGEEAELFVRRQLPRDAYAVLELGGRAWEAHRRRIAERFGLVDLDGAMAAPAPGGSDGAVGVAAAERELRSGSRLFIVDVGTDPAELRRQYPDRTSCLIAPAQVRLRLDRDPLPAQCASPGCRLRGSVSLLIDEVSVPRRWQSLLAGGQRARSASGRSGEQGPRYEVVLRAGTRHEPWISAIRPMADAR